MSGSEAEPLSSGSPGVDRVIRECRAWLKAERGELDRRAPAAFSAGPISGSIHCDFGPPTQDKNANQDYALAWLPAAEGDHGRLPRLVLALADGLTNSFRSEWAAAAACWAAVRCSGRECRKRRSARVGSVRFQRGGPEGDLEFGRGVFPRSRVILPGRTIPIDLEIHFEQRRAVSDDAELSMAGAGLFQSCDYRRRGSIMAGRLCGENKRPHSRRVQSGKASKSMLWGRPNRSSMSSTAGGKRTLTARFYLL